MNRPSKEIPIRQQRLLAEWVCRDEESQGHPAQASEAEQDAIKLGGSFVERVRHRAILMDGDGTRLAQVSRILQAGKVIALVLCALAAAGGVFAASAALGRDEIISLPLILFALVGLNLLSLSLWILLRLLGGRGNGLLAMAWRWMNQRLSPADSVPEEGLLRIVLSGRAASWRVSLLSQAAWLAYTLAGLACLLTLLSVRQYQLDWQTTLLSEQSLRAWAVALSYPHQWLGAPGPDLLPMHWPMSAEHQRGWARWLLIAVAIYGLVPRVLAWALCGWHLRRIESAWGANESRPGLARLRNRLLPQRGPSQLVDPDNSEAPQAMRASTERPIRPLPDGELLKLAIDWMPDNRSPAGWLARVEDSASRKAAEQALREAEASGLIIVVPAIATPDRGMERTCALLVAAASAPTWLALAQVPQLRARGDTVFQQRLEDWSALALRAGIAGGLGQWSSDSQALEAIDA